MLVVLNVWWDCVLLWWLWIPVGPCTTELSDACWKRLTPAYESERCTFLPNFAFRYFMLGVLCRPATSCQQLEVTWWPWGTNAYYWSSSFSSLCEWSIVPSSVWLNCVSLGNSDIKHSGRNVYTSSPGKKQMPLALQFIAIIIPANSCKYRIKHDSVLTNPLSPLLQS